MFIAGGGGKPFGYTKVCIICDEAFTSYSDFQYECLCPECRKRIVKILYGAKIDEVDTNANETL